MYHDAVKEACAAVGGQSALARKMGLKSQGSVQRWVKTGYVPPKRVLRCELETGVSRHRIRPDMYPTTDEVPQGDHQ